jgi:hypothetical protein
VQGIFPLQPIENNAMDLIAAVGMEIPFKK